MSLIQPVGYSFSFIPTDSRGNTVTACNAGSGYLKTGATGGFLYVPQMSGAPNSTGATGYTGTVAMCFDTQNNMPWYLNPNNTFGGSTGPARLNWVAGNGQVLIGKLILTSATGTVSFTGISQAFNHLKMMSVVRTDIANLVNSVAYRLNGDSGSNYSIQTSNTSQTTVNAYASVSQTSASVGLVQASSIVANYPGINVVEIPSYTNSTFNKVLISSATCTSSTSAQNYHRVAGGGWNNTSAVTSIDIIPIDGGNFIVGSLFYLYGVW